MNVDEWMSGESRVILILRTKGWSRDDPPNFLRRGFEVLLSEPSPGGSSGFLSGRMVRLDGGDYKGGIMIY